MKWIFNKKKPNSTNNPTGKIHDEIELKNLYIRVIKLFDQENFYLNKNLKLSNLAHELSANERAVSQAINKFSNDNFNKFINSFRIEYAKKLLAGGALDHYTIEAIAEECGFSNKVSFYNAFKSKTGMSPTEFRASKQLTL